MRWKKENGIESALVDCALGEKVVCCTIYTHRGARALIRLLNSISPSESQEKERKKKEKNRKPPVDLTFFSLSLSPASVSYEYFYIQWASEIVAFLTFKADLHKKLQNCIFLQI